MELGADVSIGTGSDATDSMCSIFLADPLTKRAAAINCTLLKTEHKS
jgi:hypothetical protein